MKKLFFIVAASICAMTAFAASGDKPSTGRSSDEDTGVVVKDEQADNVKDKKAVKKASPGVKQNAREEADKAKTQKDKGDSRLTTPPSDQ